jgi:hypothetical protein
MLRVVLFTLYIAVVVYCISDAVQRPEKQPYGVPRWAWVMIILLFPFLGAGAWLYMKYSRGTGGSRPKPRGPVAPDDDPEYLAWLRDQERRRKRQGGE